MRQRGCGKEQTLELAETCGLDVVSMHNMHGDEGSSLGPFQDESSAVMARMEGKWWPDALQKARGATTAKMTDLFVVQKLQQMIKVEEQALQKKSPPKFLDYRNVKVAALLRASSE